MEVTIANCHVNCFYSTELQKDKIEFKKNVKSSKSMTKEVMSIFLDWLIWCTEKPKLEDEKSTAFKDTLKKRLTLKKQC